MKIYWSTLALERVLEIADYKAYDNEEKASQWVEEIFDSVKRLEDFPQSGRIVPEIKREEIREVFFEKYRIVYKQTPEQIKILTVRHMRQQLGESDIEN